MGLDDGLDGWGWLGGFGRGALEGGIASEQLEHEYSDSLEVSWVVWGISAFGRKTDVATMVLRYSSGIYNLDS